MVVFSDTFKGREFRVGDTPFVRITDTLRKGIKHLKNHETLSEISDGVCFRVHKYREKWVLDVRRLDMNAQFTLDGICISETASQALEDAMSGIVDILCPVVEHVMSLSMVEQLILYILYVFAHSEIEKLAVDECDGCMGKTNGFHTTCIIPPYDKAMIYADQAIKHISRDRVQKAIKMVLNDSTVNSSVCELMKSSLFERLVKSPKPPNCELFSNIVNTVKPLL